MIVELAVGGLIGYMIGKDSKRSLSANPAYGPMSRQRAESVARRLRRDGYRVSIKKNPRGSLVFAYRK